jgi:hypothetical protein
MEKKVAMLIVGLFVIVGLWAMALCQDEVTEATVTTEEEAAGIIEEAPTDTGPPFVEVEDYEQDMAELQVLIISDNSELQAAIDAEEAVRIAADAALQADIDAEEAARIAADTALQAQIDTIGNPPLIPITQADIPLTITTPGSYYLTEDVTSTTTAISVYVDDVTIDLCGFAVVGPDPTVNYYGIVVGTSNVEIRNGTVRDFSIGINGMSHSCQGLRVINVRAVSNTTSGISLLGKGHLVKDCTVLENGESSDSPVYGIFAETYSIVTGNTVSNNGNSATGWVYGIYAITGSMVTGNTVSNNGESAGYVYGIYSGYGCTVTGNTVRYNGTSANNNVYAIRTDSGSTVTGNTAHSNGYSAKGTYVYGIKVGNGCTVTGNTAMDNGDNALNARVWGIYTGTYCLVDQNTAYSNGDSAYFADNMNTSTGCEYVRNVAPAP